MTGRLPAANCLLSRSFAVAGFALAAAVAGCAIVDVGVSNPMPSVRRVAIAPFLNLSTQPDIDYQTEELKSGTFSDRRFALAYFAELQKTPGFEAIPVGVVERTILNNRLPMNGPEDYVAAAEAIGADAICVGAVTDFDPYHPRLGLQVNWYALADVVPPYPTTPYERSNAKEHYLPPKRTLRPRLRNHVGPTLPGPWIPGGLDGGGDSRDEGAGDGPDDGPCIRGQDGQPIKPLYSYTRFFDGRDAALTARLRDYVELSGDIRSGGWESYLNRSDDFIRFCSHVMIEEMLLLHGGQSHREVIFKKRRQK